MDEISPRSDGTPAQEAAPDAEVTLRDVWWRKRWFVVSLIILAGVVMAVASMTVWVRRQALDTDRWTEASGQLLRDDQLRQALSVYIVDEAFARTDTIGEVRDRLPAALQPLAGQFAASLRGGAINVTEGILARPGTQRTWGAINRATHGTLIEAIDNGDRDVVLDVNPLVAEVRARLGLSPPPPEVGRLVIIHENDLDRARTYVTAIRSATLFSWLAVIALLATAIWLAAGWRRTAIVIAGWTTVAVGIALLVVRKVSGTIIIDTLAGDSEAHDAAAAAWPIATTLLSDVAQAVVALGILVVVGAAICGPSRYAVAIRSRLAPVFRRAPAVVYGGFVVVALLVLLALPSAGGRRLVGTLVLLAMVLAGLEALRRLTLREFPAPVGSGDGDRQA